MNEVPTAATTEMNGIPEKHRTAHGQADDAMRAQRTELKRMLAELRELQTSIKAQQGADVPALIEENATLRGLLEEQENRPARNLDQAPADNAKELEELKSENVLLHQLLQEKDSAFADLKKQLVDVTNQLQAKPAAPPQIMDLDNFEAELHKERQQLEGDRAKLQKEIEQLRVRNAELDDATREMEMEMSKERAEFGRERTRLERLREEVRAEAERVQREAGVRESLAPVNKLREEMNQKKGAGKTEGARVNDRLHSFRNRLSDTPT